MADFVRLDGLDAHVELTGNLLVAIAFSDEAQHSRFAIAEDRAGRRGVGAFRRGQVAHDFRRHMRIQIHAAGGDAANRAYQILGGGPLEHEAACADIEQLA